MNNEEPKDPEDGRTVRLKIAHGIMWMLIWLGLGGCLALSTCDRTPVVQIKYSK